MRLWRRRRRPATQRWSPPDPIPDHDRALLPGQRRWADLLRAAESPLREPTAPLPVLSSPLMTRLAWWRTRGSGG